MPRALVASATKLTAKNTPAAGRRVDLPWQERALSYYDLIGELRFCSQFYARMLSRVEFFPATRDADDKLTRITSGPALDLFDRIQDPGGGRSQIQYNYGRLMFITGEGVLLVTGEETDEEKWRFLWREEVVMDGDVAVRRDMTGDPTDERGKGYRMWTPHPRWSEWADSPLKSVLDIAEELIVLTAAVRSTAVTRLLNGILAYPTEIAPIGDEDENMDDDPERNPFLQKFIDHIQSQIENPGSAAARVPFLWEGGYEYLDRIKWIEMHNPATDYMEKDLRAEAIDRLALALDLPPEALKGLSDANHWTGQQVKWDMWQTHGIPIAQQFAHDVSEAYLRPALRAEDENWEDIAIDFDDSQVVVSPDQTTVADEAMDRAAISFKGYRSLKGIPEDFEPSEEEKAFVFGLKTRDPVVAGLEEQAPSVSGPATPPVSGQNGQSMTPPQPTGGRVVSRQEARIASASIMGAAHLALRQCRAKAGARLRTAVNSPSRNVERCEECQQTIEGLPNAVVASALGLELLEQMSARDPITMVKGGTDDFRGCLEDWGIDTANAGVLCERIESYAAQTLFEPNTPDLPVGFASHVEHALEIRHVDSREAV